MRTPFNLKRQQPEAMRPPEPAIFVIFGVTGNLASHMLLPALYHLFKDNLLHEHTVVVGLSRHKLSASELLKHVELCILEADKTCDPHVLARFKQHFQLLQLDAANASDYDSLKKTLDDIETSHGLCMNRLFYLAIPPQVYRPVIEHLGERHLNTGCQHHTAVSRLLVEKPFGYDLASAKELISRTAKYFTESQVFRIDHYLAKEAAQNLLIFRAENPLFTSAWNNQHITSIDLLFSEQIDVEGRANFYDSIGAVRDVMQNHLMQLLVLTTMELPGSIHDEAKLHRAKKQLLAQTTLADQREYPPMRAQYAGYQTEVGNPGSTTETYAKVRLAINNRRWRNVPVTLKAGKALATKQTTISLAFADKANTAANNCLTFQISPEEAISVRLVAKKPGFEATVEDVDMAFSYRKAFGNASHPDAYERVLVDTVHGNHALFASSREVLESWRILQPVLDLWAMSSRPLPAYTKGSLGPA